jgi:catechol 2,3-dioxygenase
MTPGAGKRSIRVMTTETSIHPAVRVGHVHLKVSDLDRSLAFYRDALGFTVTADARSVGVPAVFLAAGDYHHHIALNTFETQGAPAPPPRRTGLCHVAFLYPDRCELARAVERLRAHAVTIDHATDHGGTVAVYLEDPDGNGVELSYDRPRETWFDEFGRPVLRNDNIPVSRITDPEGA